MSLLQEALTHSDFEQPYNELWMDCYLVHHGPSDEDIDQKEENRPSFDATMITKRSRENSWNQLAKHADAWASSASSFALDSKDSATRKQSLWMAGEAPSCSFHRVHNSNENNDPTEWCLRIACRYGGAVADEYRALRYMQAYSTQHTDVAVRCTDRDAPNASLLLILTAQVAPEWIDQCPDMEHRCWMHKGKIHLIPPSIDVHGNHQRALQALHQQQSHVYQSMQQAFSQHIAATKHSEHVQRTVVALPRRLAGLFHHHPGLLLQAIASFGRYCREEPQLRLEQSSDWVQMPVAVPRAAYAQWRTSLSPHWPTEDSLPSSHGVNVPICLSPVIPAAVPLGVRLWAGLEYMIRYESDDDRRPVDDCGEETTLPSIVGDSQKYMIYLTDVAPYDMPRTFPRQALARAVQDLCQEQQSDENSQDDPLPFVTPSPSNVDGEEWMVQEMELQERQQAQLDEVLGGVQSFVGQSSDAIEGISTTSRPKIQIDPTVFLNILHHVLQAESVQDLDTPTQKTRANNTASKNAEDDDPYFYAHDYDIGVPDEELISAMAAMDAELQGNERVSRGLDADMDGQGISESAHVLSNLLRALQAEGGGPGPVRNMMREMGLEPPQVEENEDLS